MRKTNRDIARESRAHQLNEDLSGTGMSVVAGGSRGPYTLSVQYLSERRLTTLIALIRESGIVSID